MALAQRSTSPIAPRFQGDESAVACLARAGDRGQGQPQGESESVFECERDDRADLLATLESEIIPRLMLAHRADPFSPTLCADSRLPPTDGEVFEFARIAALAPCTDAKGPSVFSALGSAKRPVHASLPFGAT